MPINFQYVRNSDKQVMVLDEIDREMCERTGFPYSKTQYCPMFQYAQFTGMSMCRETGHVTVESFDKRIAEGEHGYTPEEITLLREFFYEKYTFHCWRGM